MNIMEEICENLSQHQFSMMKAKNEKEIDTRNKAWILYPLLPKDLITLTYGHMLTNIERKSELANLLASIGGCIFRSLRKELKRLRQEEEPNNFRINELQYFLGTHDKKGKSYISSADELNNKANSECDKMFANHVKNYYEEKANLFIKKLEDESNLVEIKEVHLAWLVLQPYLDLEILSLDLKVGKKAGGRSKKHTSYQVRVMDATALHSIMDNIELERVELFPMRTKPAHWVSKQFFHEDGYPIIKKKPHQAAVKKVKEGCMDYAVDTINKLGDVGWRINPFVFSVFKEAKTHQGKTPFKAMKEVDPEKKASLLIELGAIERLAERNLNNAFYHLYNFDFRGRIYPNTAFLHEQSSDNAKGLLLLDSSVPLGGDGMYWLCVHTANMFGNDKVSLDERAQFVLDNWQTYMGYVEDPLINDDWMDADKPLCFLACCSELALINDWVNSHGQKVEDFQSNLPIYIDGSNNGVQHLVAMSKDEKIAHLVNLVPQEIPGDVYMFIADKTMEVVNKEATKTPLSVSKRFEDVCLSLSKLKEGIAKASSNPKSELYRKSVSKLGEYKNQNYDLKKQMGAMFWNKIKDRKTWRKTVKRPVMTLGYGGTPHGMVDMVEDDTRGLSTYLRDKDYSWSVYLGHLIYKTCKKELEGPAAMLDMFEKLGLLENSKNKHVAYNQIVTGFPMVQLYVEGKTSRIKLYRGESVYDISVSLRQKKELNKAKQKQSTAPNIVHSVDAAHLTMVVHDADYEVTVVHDSFGCHAGNMGYMFEHVRNKFVELYELEPLEHIFEQMNALHLIPEKGNLNVSEIIQSDFAFA
jgi:DNA-directed RNA polymerase